MVLCRNFYLCIEDMPKYESTNSQTTSKALHAQYQIMNSSRGNLYGDIFCVGENFISQYLKL